MISLHVRFAVIFHISLLSYLLPLYVHNPTVTVEPTSTHSGVCCELVGIPECLLQVWLQMLASLTVILQCNGIAEYFTSTSFNCDPIHSPLMKTTVYQGAKTLGCTHNSKYSPPEIF